MNNDSRPRVNYRLPTGETVAIIFDHGDRIPPTTTFQLKDGRVVLAFRAVVAAEHPAVTAAKAAEARLAEIARTRRPTADETAEALRAYAAAAAASVSQ